VVNTVRGVPVILPHATTSFGYTFRKGLNHLNGLHALYYARQRSLTEEGRVLRQQGIIRAVLRKIGNRHLLSNPLTMMKVLDALTAMLTVDSNFTDAELAELADELKYMSGSAGTFVTAPTSMIAGQVFLRPRISDQLWQAIRRDALAAFARRYPFTVTPIAVP